MQSQITAVLHCLLGDLSDQGQRHTLGTIEDYLYGVHNLLREPLVVVPKGVTFAYEMQMMDVYGMAGYIKKHCTSEDMNWQMLGDIPRYLWEHHPVFVTLDREKLGIYVKDQTSLLPIDKDGEMFCSPVLVVMRARVYSSVPFPQSVREYLGGQKPFLAT